MPYDLPSTQTGRSKRYDALIALALARRFAPPPPPVPGELVVGVPFAFNTASPLILQAVAAGTLLNRADILITTAFDDPAATLRLGTAASPSLVLAAADNLPSRLGQYQTEALTLFVAPDNLQLSISPAASTMGAGIVFFKLKL
jgi:hypothetical protein